MPKDYATDTGYVKRVGKSALRTVGSAIPILGAKLERSRAGEKADSSAHEAVILRGEALAKLNGLRKTLEGIENEAAILHHGIERLTAEKALTPESVDRAYGVVKKDYAELTHLADTLGVAVGEYGSQRTKHKKDLGYGNNATTYATGAILILAGALGMIAFTATNVTGAVIGAPISDFNIVAASIFALVAVVGVLFSLRR